MEEEFLLLLLGNWQYAYSKSCPRQLRDHSDPFSIPNEEFKKLFRLPKSMCHSIIEDLLPHDEQGTQVPFAWRFLIALHFYVSGTFQKRLGDNNVFHFSQSTVSRALQNISELLVMHKGEQICFPRTNEHQLEVKEGFEAKYDMKNVLGAIGTTHMRLNIKKPSNNCPYKNEYNEFSIKVEGICDHRLLFTSLNARSPGSFSNSSIWFESAAREVLLTTQQNSYSNNAWLLGDSTYPLEPWLLTPVTNNKYRADVAYNYKHRAAHNTIKNAFALLRTRFKCLSHHRKLLYTHERSANIIYACAILHNMLIKYGGCDDIKLNKEEFETPHEESIARATGVEAMLKGPKFVDGRTTRECFIKSLRIEN